VGKFTGKNLQAEIYKQLLRDKIIVGFIPK